MVVEGREGALSATVVDGLHGRILVDGSGDGTVVWSGEGDEDFLCGSCGVPIVRGASMHVRTTHAFRCRSCLSFNVLSA